MMPFLSLAASFVIGTVAGVAYFSTIWWSARRFAQGGHVTVTIALSFVRLATLGGLLALASFQGPGPLLALAMGVVVARFGVMRRLHGEMP